MGFTMRTPKTLPDVPTEDELRAVLATCPDTLEGTRNPTKARSRPPETLTPRLEATSALLQSTRPTGVAAVERMRLD